MDQPTHFTLPNYTHSEPLMESSLSSHRFITSNKTKQNKTEWWSLVAVWTFVQRGMDRSGKNKHRASYASDEWGGLDPALKLEQGTDLVWDRCWEPENTVKKYKGDTKTPGC